MQGGRWETNILYSILDYMYYTKVCTDTVSEFISIGTYVGSRFNWNTQHADIRTLHVHLYSKWTLTDNPSDDIYSNNCW